MYAEGYDEKHKQVSWTLDTWRVSGQIAFDLGYMESGEFVLHLNLDVNVKTIRIYASSYDIVIP